MVRNYSTIQISSETKYRLKSLALTPRESFENILLRLLDAKLNGRELKYNIRDKKHGKYNINAVVDWGSDVENIMFVDKQEELRQNIPRQEYDDSWSEFFDKVEELKNIVGMFSVLEFDEEIRAGDLILKRIS